MSNVPAKPPVRNLSGIASIPAGLSLHLNIFGAASLASDNSCTVWQTCIRGNICDVIAIDRKQSRVDFARCFNVGPELNAGSIVVSTVTCDPEFDVRRAGKAAKETL